MQKFLWLSFFLLLSYDIVKKVKEPKQEPVLEKNSTRSGEGQDLNQDLSLNEEKFNSNQQKSENQNPHRTYGQNNTHIEEENKGVSLGDDVEKIVIKIQHWYYINYYEFFKLNSLVRKIL